MDRPKDENELTDEQLEHVVGGLNGVRLERYVAGIMNTHSGSMVTHDRRSSSGGYWRLSYPGPGDT